MCIDYMDLNKATCKDDFSLPYIDVLIDNVAGQDMYSFLNGLLGYNQIIYGSRKQGEDLFYHWMKNLLLQGDAFWSK